MFFIAVVPVSVGHHLVVVRVKDEYGIGNVGLAQLLFECPGANDTSVWSGLEFAGDGDGVIMLCKPIREPGFGMLVVVEGCGLGLMLVLVEPCWIPVGDGQGPGVAIGEVLVQVCGDVQCFRGHGLLLSFVLFVYTLSIAPVAVLSISVSWPVSLILHWLAVRVVCFDSSLGRVVSGTWHLLGVLMIEDQEPVIMRLGFLVLLWMMYGCLYWC